MLKVAIAIGGLFWTVTIYSLARVTGDSDKKLDKLFEVFPLREEQKNGDSSKEVSQTA